MGFLLKLFTGNPLTMVWVIGGVALAAFAAGGSSAWVVQGWRMEAQETDWQTREAKINADTAIKIAAAHDRVRDLEQDIAQELANESAGYQQKLKEKDRALELALNAMRSGSVRLSGHGAACTPVSGNSANGAATPASGRDGAAGGKLLNEADWVFLQSEAARADKVVLQLSACQGVVRTDRKQEKPRAVK